MLEVGRVCYKTAGRDSNNVCVVVSNEGSFVTIDGNVRRKKVNALHVEPTPKVLKIAENADTAAVHKALEEAGYAIKKTGEKKESKPRAKKTHAQKEKPVKATPVKKETAKAPAKKTTKKAAPKAEAKVAEEKVVEAKTEEKQ